MQDWENETVEKENIRYPTCTSGVTNLCKNWKRVHNTQTTGLLNFHLRRNKTQSLFIKTIRYYSSARTLKSTSFTSNTKRNTARPADYNERGKEKNTTRKRIILRTNFSSTTPENYNWITLTLWRTSSEI